MKAKYISRRHFVSDVALFALTVGLSSCTKTVTKYRSDGTPYTEEVDDPVATLAAVLLGLIALGAIAASSRDDESSWNYEGDEPELSPENEEVQLASWSNWPRLAEIPPGLSVSVVDSNGNLLATGDSEKMIKHHDTRMVASLLTTAGISDLSQPIGVRLRLHDSDSYHLESIQPCSRHFDRQWKTLVQMQGDRLFIIHVLLQDDGTTDLKIKSRNLAGRHVT